MTHRSLLTLAAAAALALGFARPAAACGKDCDCAKKASAAPAGGTAAPKPADAKPEAKPEAKPTTAADCGCEKGGKGCTCPKGQCTCANCKAHRIAGTATQDCGCIKDAAPCKCQGQCHCRPAPPRV